MGISLTVFINPNVSLSLDETTLVTRGVPRISNSRNFKIFFPTVISIGVNKCSPSFSFIFWKLFVFLFDPDILCFFLIT